MEADHQGGRAVARANFPQCRFPSQRSLLSVELDQHAGDNGRLSQASMRGTPVALHFTHSHALDRCTQRRIGLTVKLPRRHWPGEEVLLFDVHRQRFSLS